MEKKKERVYVAIDLKSFYASQECVARGWDPLTTNLVVADASRTDKTICLAVTPALKSFGVPGRPRLFEVNEILRQKNASGRCGVFDIFFAEALNAAAFKTQFIGFGARRGKNAHAP